MKTVSCIACCLAALLPTVVSAAGGDSLPLRADGVIDAGVVLRILCVLVLLLGSTAALLWLYRRRWGTLPPGFRVQAPQVEVIARLRLTPRTQVFVIRRGEREFLVTESGNGATTLPVDHGTPMPATEPKP